MVAAKKTAPATEKAQPVKTVRKPRVPKPVNDLATANAAFQKAKRMAENATKNADQARTAEKQANEYLAEAAKVLKGYMGEVDAAVAGVLPTEAEDVQVTDADTAHPEYIDYESPADNGADGYNDRS